MDLFCCMIYFLIFHFWGIKVWKRKHKSFLLQIPIHLPLLLKNNSYLYVFYVLLFFPKKSLSIWDVFYFYHYFSVVSSNYTCKKFWKALRVSFLMNLFFSNLDTWRKHYELFPLPSSLYPCLVFCLFSFLPKTPLPLYPFMFLPLTCLLLYFF